MRSCLLNLTLTLFVLGGTVCPCAAQFLATDDNHVMVHAGHGEGHGEPPNPVRGDHHCESCTEAGAATNSFAASLPASTSPTFDDDGDEFPAPVDVPAAAGSPRGGAPPLHTAARTAASPVSLGDRRIE